MRPGAISFHGRTIEGVTVDFWWTIAGDRDDSRRGEARARAATAWFAEQGQPRREEEVSAALVEWYKHWEHEWLRRRRTPGPLDCAAHLSERLAVPLDEEQTAALGRRLEEVFLEASPEPVEGALEGLRTLAGRLPLALVCDTGVTGPRVLDEWLRRRGVFDLFKARIYSLDVGVAKPAPGMFFTALEALGVPQHRALHIGDLEATDILGAKSLGMAAIRFDGGKEERDCSACSMADLVVRRWEEIPAALGIEAQEEA